MKINIITCHNVYNYGASLQAFALQHYLEQRNMDVEIIDFRPWFQRGRYDLFYLPKVNRSYKYTQWCPPLRFLVGPIVNAHKLRTFGRKIRFDRFTKEYLRLTPQQYHDSETLREVPPEADLYIAGSDQIWNPDMYNGHEPAYFLDFGKQTTKRISYAASFGIDHIKQHDCEFIKKNLLHFDAISVREKTGLDILKRIGIKNAVHVVDPVFLLTAPQWSNLTKTASQIKIPNYNYILLYDFVNDHKIGSFVKMCAKQTGMQILSVNDYRSIPYADQNINNAGPWEFISLIEHANIVISNSFHATAFSCIFNKEFYTFPLNTQQNSSRMTDLLSCAKMPERFNPQKRWTSNIFGTQFMETSIETSKYFLDHHLNINFIL